MARVDLVPLGHGAVPQFVVSFGFSSMKAWLMTDIVPMDRQSTKVSGNLDSWFVLAVSTLGKEAVEGRDGFTAMVLPNGQSNVQSQGSCEGRDRESGSSGRVTLCWEFMGASVTEP